MFELVAGMEFGVVAAAGLPHFPEDLEPALARERSAQAWDLPQHGLIVDLSHGEHCRERFPKMDGGTQGLIAESAQIDFMDLPDW